MDREQIDQPHGSLGRIMMTLCLTVSGGMAWLTAAAPIVKSGTGHGVIWTSYIAFMIFGMLNVLAGIFVDISSAKLKRRELADKYGITQMCVFPLWSEQAGVLECGRADGLGSVEASEGGDTNGRAVGEDSEAKKFGEKGERGRP